MNPALIVTGAFFVIAVVLGLVARRGHDMNLEQWTLGGRGFGAILVFVLMAGEIYTTFTFLGGSGWAYGKGAPAFYILCYGAIAYTFSYFLLPVIWRYGQEKRLVSQADYFVAKYDSRALGILVSLVGVAALVPYLVLQLKGLGIIMSEASYGTFSSAAAIWTGTVALVAYVVVSGVRGSAWTAALKDIMIFAVVLTIGVYLPIHYHGSFGEMFHAIDHAKPGFLTLPNAGMSPVWLISTVLLTACGFYMWPQYFATTYTAHDENVFRKNAVLLPIYQLVILFVFFAGFSALLAVPGLKGADADLSLLRVSKVTFNSWIVGLIGAAGLLTALVPGSMILITATTIIAKNLYRPLAPTATDKSVGGLARALVPVVAIVAAVMALNGGQAIVALLLMGYNFVTQLFPALLLSLPRQPRLSAAAAFAGIAAGEATVAYLSLTSASVATLLPDAPQFFKDLNVGIVALLVNLVVTAVMSLVVRPRPTADLAPAPR